MMTQTITQHGGYTISPTQAADIWRIIEWLKNGDLLIDGDKCLDAIEALEDVAQELALQYRD